MNNIKQQGINIDGIEKEYSLNDFKGQKVILYFYPKDNTYGCTQEACDFRDNINRAQGRIIFTVLPIHLFTIEEIFEAAKNTS